MHSSWASEATSTTGTGDLTTTQISGWPRITSIVPTGHRFPYTIKDATTGAPLEAGIGYYSATGTFKREKPMKTYLSSTLSIVNPTAVSLPAGTYHLVLSPNESTTGMGLPFVSTTSSGQNNKSVDNAWAVGVRDQGAYAATDTADRFNFVPFLLNFEGPFDGFRIHVVTAQASKSLYVGLYEFGTDGAPGALVVKGSAAIDMSSTGMKTASFTSRYIAPGWYYAGIGTNCTTGQITRGGIPGGATPAGMTDSGTAFYLYRVDGAGTITDMPNTFTGFTNSASTTQVPQIMLKVA